jgi:hypothetical protein
MRNHAHTGTIAIAIHGSTDRAGRHSDRDRTSRDAGDLASLVTARRHGSDHVDIESMAKR